jgi:hypothetical protein
MQLTARGWIWLLTLQVSGAGRRSQCYLTERGYERLKAALSSAVQIARCGAQWEVCPNLLLATPSNETILRTTKKPFGSDRAMTRELSINRRQVDLEVQLSPLQNDPPTIPAVFNSQTHCVTSLIVEQYKSHHIAR